MRSIERVRAWFARQDVIIAKAGEFERSAAVQKFGERVTVAGYAGPFDAHRPMPASINDGKSGGVHLAADGDGHEPRASRRAQKQIDDGLGVPSIRQTHAAAFEEWLQPWRRACRHLLHSCGLMRSSGFVAPVQNGPHAKGVRRLAGRCPCAGRTDNFRPWRSIFGLIGVCLRDGVRRLDSEMIMSAADKASFAAHRALRSFLGLRLSCQMMQYLRRCRHFVSPRAIR